MSLLQDIKKNHLNANKLNNISLDAIRVTVEACDCPKDNLCVACRHLLEFYKWKQKENKKHTDKAVDWIIHQCCIIAYGPKYKEQGLHFNKDIYTLKTIVELYKDYMKEVNSLG